MIQSNDTTLSIICKGVIYVGTALILFTPLIVPQLINLNLFFPFVSLKGMYLFLLVEIILAAWLILLLVEGKYKPKLNIITVFFSLTILVFILSAMFGVNPETSFWSNYSRMEGALGWLHLFAFFIVISSFFVKKEQWIKLFFISVSAAAFAALFGLGENFNWWEPLSSKRGATLGNTSYLGAYLLLNAFTALYLFFSVSKRNTKIVVASLFIIILGALIAMFLSDSAKAATIAVFGGFVLTGALYMLFGVRNKILKAIGGLIIAGGILASIFSGVMLFQEDNAVRDWFVGHATEARFSIWNSAWEGFKERPILGWGLESFEVVHPMHFDPCLFTVECGREIWFDRAHNVILDTLTTTGVIGLIAYSLLFISFLFVLWRRFFKKEIDVLAPAIFTSMILAHMLQNMTVFDTLSTYVPLFLVLGFGAFISSEGESYRMENWNLRGLPKIIVIIAILGALIFSVQHFSVSPYKANLKLVEARISGYASPARIEAYEKTFSISPLGNSHLLVIQAADLLSFSKGNDASEVSEEGLLNEMNYMIEKLEKELEKNPASFRTRLRLTELTNRYIQIALDQDLIPIADERSKALLEMYPNHQHSYWNRAQALVFKDRPEEAYEMTEKAIELEPRLINSYLFAANIAHNLLEDEEKTEDLRKRVIEIDPSWEEVFLNFIKSY